MTGQDKPARPPLHEVLAAMTERHRAEAENAVIASRAAQGLPPTVQDPVIIAKVRAIIAAAVASQQRPRWEPQSDVVRRARRQAILGDLIDEETEGARTDHAPLARSVRAPSVP
jgi:uncharacterized protein with ATP-grasp and redox domains